METIANAASTVTSTVTGLIYGQQPAKDGETAANETSGQEPLSGTQGKGTVNEPYDQGNAENPVDPSSTTNTAKSTGNTSYTKDDFLKLNPEVNKSTAGETGATGITDKAGVTEKVWKPTELDEVKPSGAPGAGPEAPDYKPATPDLSSKPAEKPAEASKDTTGDDRKTEGAEASHTTAKAQPSVGGPIEEVLNKGTGASKEHTVDESEAEDPHSKMDGKTHRATTANKTGEAGAVETHPVETTTSHASEGSKATESSKANEPASPSGGDEKSEKKMSQLKDKLKNKLHIGHKDK